MASCNTFGYHIVIIQVAPFSERYMSNLSYQYYYLFTDLHFRVKFEEYNLR